MNKIIEKSMYGVSVFALSISMTGVSVGVAQAQNAANAEDDEIIVSARKRTEKLLDISGSVQVFNAEIIDDFRLDNVDTVIDFTPNATFSAAPSGTPVISIRGLGTRPGSALLEQDVGLFIDGVWFGRNNQLNAALIDVQQIEVLKGTQATLYGRNTLAGAVSIQTVQPGSEFEGYIKGSQEFVYNSTAIEGAVTLPASEKLSFRLAGKYEDVGGFVNNTVLDREEPESENYSLRGTSVYTADNGIKVTGRVQYTDLNRDGNSFVRDSDTGPTRPAEFTPSAFPDAAFVGFDENALGRQISVPSLGLADVGTNQELFDWSLTAEIPVGDLTLTSITARSTLGLESVFDVFLTTPGPRIIGFFDEEYDQFTQEVRLTSPGGQKLDYIVGAFFLDQTVDRLTYQYVNEADRFWSGIQDVTSYAAFADGTYNFTDDFRLVGGARLTFEDKDADIIVHGTADEDGVFGGVQESVDTTFLSGSVTAEYDVTEDILVYAGYSRGSKAPGLADGAAIVTSAAFLTAPTQFIPQEDINTYEGGFKWEQSNGFINATGFFLDVSDFQNAAFVGGEILINSFDVDVIGFEVDTFHRFTDEISLATGFGYLDGENVDADTEITTAPTLQISGTLSYETDTLISGFTTNAGVNVNYTSSQFLNAVDDPANEVGGITLVNLNAGFTHENSGVEVSVFAKNLTDEFYQDFSFGAPFLGDTHIFGLARGREIGVELGYQF